METPVKCPTCDALRAEVDGWRYETDALREAHDKIVDALRIQLAEARGALEMVRDANEDCRKDGLPTIPPAARAKIDAAIDAAKGKP